MQKKFIAIGIILFAWSMLFLIGNADSPYQMFAYTAIITLVCAVCSNIVCYFAGYQAWLVADRKIKPYDTDNDIRYLQWWLVVVAVSLLTMFIATDLSRIEYSVSSFHATGIIAAIWSLRISFVKN